MPDSIPSGWSGARRFTTHSDEGDLFAATPRIPLHSLIVRPLDRT
jgi:hypothetical protein